MEKTHMSVVAREEKILVLVRLRPPNEKEVAANEPTDWECLNDTTILYRNTLRQSSNFPSAYSFDRVYGGECPTRQVYENGTKEIALSVVKGINCSIFAYGQTSSGKTYTMTAITEFAVADIFDYIFQHEERAFSVKFSAIEIYNEAIRDLLSLDGTSLRLRDDPVKGTVVEKATEETLRDWNHLKDLLSVCEAQRKIGETSLNERSSRSHQIIRLTVESSARELLDKENSTTLMASVNFIDLAGSERASQAMSAGARLKEGCHINRSLLTLGTVIRKLSKGRQGHINFRDSKLTRILQPYLGGNARTAIICTLSPARSHVELTRNTLLFACCAKEVTTKARINVVMSDKALLKQLQRELARLETELRTPATPASKCDCAMTTVRKKNLQIQKMEREMAELRKERDLAQSRLEDIMRMVEHDESGTPHFGNNIDKWEDGSVSQTSGMIAFISDGMSTPLSIARAYVGSHSDDDEELPTRSEDPSEEYCREVQCIEIEESARVNHKEEIRAQPKNSLANGDTSVGQNVNHRETMSGTRTPPENLGKDFLGRPEESHKIVFSGLELGSSVVSRNDSLSSCDFYRQRGGNRALSCERTMVKATKAEKKIAYDAKLCQLIDEFTQILVVAADNVGSTQLQNIRKGLRGDSVVLMGKNTMMKRSVKIHAENTGNTGILNLMPLLQGNVGLIFTKGDLKEVSEEVAKYKVGAPARVGLVAPIDVVVQPGNTGLDPSQTSFFQVLNIPTKINKGTVEIITPVELIKQGDKVGSSEAALLAKLGIRPFSYGLVVQSVYDNGSVFSPEVLDLTEDDLVQKFAAGISMVTSLALAISYPTLAAAPHMFINAYKNALAICIATEYTFPQAEKVKEYLKDPSKFAVAVAAVSADAGGGASAGAAKVEEKKEVVEESDEEDYGGFDMFGDE